MSDDPNDAPATWRAFAEGAHFGKRVRPVTASDDPPGDQLVSAMIAIDLGDLAAAAEILQEVRPNLAAGLSHWRDVLRAFCGPGNDSDKWGARVARLEALAATHTAPGWGGQLAEALRLCMLAECKPRMRSVSAQAALKDITTIADHARNAFLELGEDYGAARTSLAKGRIYSWVGDLVQASEALTHALLEGAQLGNRFLIAEAAYELSVAYRDLRRYRAAVPLGATCVALWEKGAAPAQLARARQGQALTLIGISDMPGENTVARLKQAKELALKAFAATTTIAEAPPELAVVNSKDQTPGGDDFRATVAARDLSEIALRLGEKSMARDWYERACAEARVPREIIEGRGGSLYSAYVAPSLQATTDGAAGATRQIDQFVALRLATLEAQIDATADPADQPIELRQIAKAYETRGEAPYALEALLLASQQSEAISKKAEADTDRYTSRKLAADAEHWRFEAVRSAVGAGASLRSNAILRPPLSLPPHVVEACAQAGVSGMQLIGGDSERYLLRVAREGHATPARLCVMRTDRALMDVVGALRTAAERESCLPRIWGADQTGHALWILDEDPHGLPLSEALALPSDTSDILLALHRIAHAVITLQATGVECAALNIDHILLLPGNKPILARYAPVLASQDELPSPLYARGPAGKSSDVVALARLATLWLSGGATANTIAFARNAGWRKFLKLKARPSDQLSSSYLSVLARPLKAAPQGRTLQRFAEATGIEAERLLKRA